MTDLNVGKIITLEKLEFVEKYNRSMKRVPSLFIDPLAFKMLREYMTILNTDSITAENVLDKDFFAETLNSNRGIFSNMYIYISDVDKTYAEISNLVNKLDAAYDYYKELE